MTSNRSAVRGPRSQTVTEFALNFCRSLSSELFRNPKVEKHQKQFGIIQDQEVRWRVERKFDQRIGEIWKKKENLSKRDESSEKQGRLPR